VNQFAHRDAAPKLRVSNGRMSLTNADGYRIELYNVNGRRMSAANGEIGGAGRFAAGVVICRMVRGAQQQSPRSIMTTRVVSPGN
jgi:hypothetical protein